MCAWTPSLNNIGPIELQSNHITMFKVWNIFWNASVTNHRCQINLVKSYHKNCVKETFLKKKDAWNVIWLFS